MTTLLQNVIAPDKLWLPTLKREIVRPWFLPDADSLKEQKKILASFFFLVRQGDTFGERLKCKRCGNRHMYISLMCVERPFSGLTRGLYAYYKYVKDSGIYAHMTDAERSRLDGISVALRRMPDLAQSHPQLARKLSADMGISDMEMGGLSFGLLEGIAAPHARKLVDKINDRGLKPKLVLEEANV